MSKCGHGDYVEKAGDAVRTKTQLATKGARKNQERTQQASKVRKQKQVSPKQPFVQQLKPVKENDEIEVVIDDIGSRGDDGI